MVTDVAAAAEQAERLGGKVVNPPKTTPNGLTFAHLLDPAGNHIGVYTRRRAASRPLRLHAWEPQATGS